MIQEEKMDERILKSMAKARDDRTKQANRQRRVSKLFFDLEQQALYGSVANQLSLPGDTFETLAIQDPGLTDEQNIAALETNLRLLSRGNQAFVEKTIAFINKAYSSPADIAALLVASWDDVKLELKKQFGGRTVQPSAFEGFIRKYLHDAGERAVTGPAKKPTQAEVGFTVMSGAVSHGELKANFDKAYQHDAALVTSVLEQKHANKDIADLTKTQLAAMQRPLYFALYGKPFEGKGKQGSAAVDYDDTYGADASFRGSPPGRSPLPTAGQSLGDWQAQQTPTRRNVTGKGVKKGKGKPPIVYGRGVSSQISAKYYVDLRKLNMTTPHLSVKYRSTARSVMDQETTQPVKSIVMSILSSSKLDERQHAKLSAAEKDQVLLFLANSGAKYVPIYVDAIEELSTKLTILVGSMNAGNDSAVLREMALETAERLHRFKAITRLEWLSLKESM
jgi:hypothetical protein